MISMPRAPLLVLPLLGVGAALGALVTLAGLTTTWTLIAGLTVIAAATALVLVLLMGAGRFRYHVAEHETSHGQQMMLAGPH
jgi:hypothetical protein